jgi:hypothetical protein
MERPMRQLANLRRSASGNRADTFPFAPSRPAEPQRARPVAASGRDLSGISGGTLLRVQPKLTIGESHDPLERDADRMADDAVGARSARPAPSNVPTAGEGHGIAAPPVVQDTLRTPGQPLDTATRAFFEPRFGRDFSGVRVHADDNAAQSARAIGAEAYTAGSHTAFAAGRYAPQSADGRHLLAHELAHVVQQNGSGGEVVRRYEAGEHSQFGQTGSQLKGLINAPQAIYTVGKNETPEFIAKAFNVPLDELLERNKAKVQMFPVKGKPKKMMPGFKEGEKIEIPPVLNDAMKDAVKTNELTYKAGQAEPGKDRATVRYGQGIAMGGDLYGKPDEIDNDSRANIDALGGLIDKEEAGVKKPTKEFVDNAEWNKATGGRFVKQALANESHFSPSNPAFAPATHAGSPNNKSEWEKFHGQALGSSQSGDRDKAYELNAFADHFLTDAFSAGHLINKFDVMEKFKSGITIKGPGPMTAKSELSDVSKVFFDQIAKAAFVGNVKTLYSQYETKEYKGVVFRPNIDSEDRFSTLLQGIYVSEPDLIANSVAKSVHDDLNTKAGGIDVENNKGDTWPLSGDRTLNQQTLEVGRKAVAQSQYNVLSVYNNKDKLDLPKLFKAVWDYVPRPTVKGAATVKASVDTGTDTKSTSLVASIVAMIAANYKLILDELVKRGILKKA